MSRFDDCVSYLYSLQKHGIKFGLNRTDALLERLGNPHRLLRCIHVAGTNGKGSVSAMLSTIVRRHGLRAGLYTSPHLVRITERFKINDVEITPEQFLSVYEKVREVVDEREPPTFFEFTTAIGLLWLAGEAPDWSVIEVGMGGRLDATNVVSPAVSVITNVALDHQEYLGTTLTAIAREKAGIVKKGVPVVTAARQPSVLGVLKAACLAHGAPLYRLGTDFRVRAGAEGTFHYQGLNHDIAGLRANLLGEHQVGNAGTAIAALEVLARRGVFPFDPGAVREALLEVRWPGRLEVLGTSPLVLLDGAHNAHGAESLRNALRRIVKHGKIYLVLGIMGDKDIRGMLRRLLPLAETAIFTRPRYLRAADPETLRRLAKPYIRRHYVIADPAEAIREARRMAAPEDCICIAGSLYFAGEVKELLGETALGPR